MSKDEVYECPCGNREDLAGFFPCDEEGNIVEPDEDWPQLYVCDVCSRITPRSVHV